jgi:hypothetical protein
VLTKPSNIEVNFFSGLKYGNFIIDSTSIPRSGKDGKGVIPRSPNGIPSGDAGSPFVKA